MSKELSCQPKCAASAKTKFMLVSPAIGLSVLASPVSKPLLSKCPGRTSLLLASSLPGFVA
eukprot:12887718-Prorocentrum_lima.AAC.1